MSKELFIQSIAKFLLGVALVGILTFVPAGTLQFTNGWLFICVVFLPMLFAGIVMMVKNPRLLKKRLNDKEQQKEQKAVVKLSAIMFILGFVVAGLDFRFGWYALPKGVSIGAAVVYLAAYLLYAEVIRENVFLSRTIEVQQNQKVIDTGLYGVVRHPMYSVTLILFMAMPIILGSLYSFVIFLFYPFIIVKRIKNEEMLLENELTGYCEYKKKVKYRLIPFVW